MKAQTMTAAHSGALSDIGLRENDDLPQKQVIGVRNLTVTYPGGIDAIRDLTLGINDHEFIVILGPSGCGKSTLLQVLAGLQKPTAGSVLINGIVNPSPGLDRAFVFQQSALLPWFTVIENIAIGLRTKGLSKSNARDISRRFVDKLGLSGFGDRYPHQLSGGMQQRVGVARAFAVDPPVLLMDEPFAALDAQTRLLLQEELISLWEGARKTIVFVTHSIEEAVFLADRIVVMGRGPGAIKTIVNVPLPRPRTEATRMNVEFRRLFDMLWGMLRDDAQRAIAPSE